MKICDLCGHKENEAKSFCLSRMAQGNKHVWVEPTVLPEEQGARTARRSRHDLIPLEFLDELASIFEEGLTKYGDSWKKGGRDFLVDCLNHASNHLHKYCNGDISENQLSKVAWNVLVVRYFDLKGEGLNGQTRESKQDDGKRPAISSDVERDVRSSTSSESGMVGRLRQRTTAKTECSGNAVSDPQRDF